VSGAAGEPVADRLTGGATVGAAPAVTAPPGGTVAARPAPDCCAPAATGDRDGVPVPWAGTDVPGTFGAAVAEGWLAGALEPAAATEPAAEPPAGAPAGDEADDAGTAAAGTEAAGGAAAGVVTGAGVVAGAGALTGTEADGGGSTVRGGSNVAGST
jgi:hypothetical protein